MLGRWGEGGMRCDLDGDCDFDFDGLEGGVMSLWGVLDRGGELGMLVL